MSSMPKRGHKSNSRAASSRVKLSATYAHESREKAAGIASSGLGNEDLVSFTENPVSVS